MTESKTEVEFEARFFVFSDDLLRYQIWVREFYPTSSNRRPAGEWIAEMFDIQYDTDDVREMLNLPTDGGHQCLVKGYATSVFRPGNWAQSEDDYDSFVTITNVESQEIPTEDESEMRMCLVGYEIPLEDTTREESND